MTDPINIDTLDLIAAALGAVLGMTLLVLISGGNSGLSAAFERYDILLDLLMMGSVLLPVFLKRQVSPTVPLRPDSAPILRLVYLLTTLLGGLCLGGAGVAAWMELQAGGMVGAGIATPAGAGAVLLAISSGLDRMLR
jgi:hypothetical protein